MSNSNIEVNAPALIVNNIEHVIEALQSQIDGLEGSTIVKSSLNVLYETLEMANRLIEYLRELQNNGDKVSMDWTEFLDKLKGKNNDSSEDTR